MFKKYPSLTNHYQMKDINRFMESANQVNEPLTYAVYEKIDGANISFLLQQGAMGKVKVFSRNQEITGDNFMSSSDVIEDMTQFLVKKTMNLPVHIENIRFYGELFGPGIQKRVNYGDKKRILFYDVMVNDRMVPPKEVEVLTRMYGLSDVFIEPLGYYHDFNTAWDANINFNSHYGPSFLRENLAEGIVIKPWERSVFTPVGSIFYIKKKNEKFGDKKEREPRPMVTYSSEIEKMREDFLEYVNENLLYSVFSKEGEMESAKDIGKYIPLMIKDAMDTFQRDAEIDPDSLEKDDRKYVFGCVPEVVELMKNFLQKG